MTRMHETIRRSLRNYRQNMEDETFESLADHCILHFLYGPREGKQSDMDSLQTSLQVPFFMESLLKEESPKVFTDMLREFFTDGPESGEFVRLFTVEATPSEEAAEALAAEERELVRSRELELGPEGLEAADAAQEAAHEAAQKSSLLPNDLFDKLDIPALSSIHLPDVTYRSQCIDPSRNRSCGEFPPGTLSELSDLLPYEVGLTHVDSAFATASCLFSTQSLDLRQSRLSFAISAT